jgi:hypothetical protein
LCCFVKVPGGNVQPTVDIPSTDWPSCKDLLEALFDPFLWGHVEAGGEGIDDLSAACGNRDPDLDVPSFDSLVACEHRV